MWLIQNKLTLNIKKSCHIVFGKKDINLNLVIDNDQLIQKDVTKYLGLQIDQHLKWKPHVEMLMTSLVKASGVLYRLNKYVSRPTLRMVYNALVKSKLQYGIILWGCANKTTLDRLNKLHNKALRTVTGLPYKTAINKLYSNARALKTFDLYKYALAQYMFKLYSKTSSSDNFIDNIALVNTIHNYNTRQAKNKNYFVSNMLTSQKSNSLLVDGVKVWNQLPPYVKSETRVSQFNKLVFKQLLSSYSPLKPN